MSFVQMMILGVVGIGLTLIFSRKDTFIEHFKLKGSLVSFEVEIKAKQKDVPLVNKKRPNNK